MEGSLHGAEIVLKTIADVKVEGSIPLPSLR